MAIWVVKLLRRNTKLDRYFVKKQRTIKSRVLTRLDYKHVLGLTLLGLGLIKINNVSANFINPRPSLILNN